MLEDRPPTAIKEIRGTPLRLEGRLADERGRGVAGAQEEAAFLKKKSHSVFFLKKTAPCLLEAMPYVHS
jgi:hypothetical protein